MTDRFASLATKIDGELSSAATTRAMYATDASIYRVLPAAVAWPRHHDDVATIVEWARSESVPLHGRGAGSNLTGACLGSGLVIDFRRFMTEIVDIDAAGKCARVQPGVVHTDLNAALARYGLFFPPDPASGDYCTIGGMIANNSSGARSVKYGATIDWIDTLQVVTADHGCLSVARHQRDGQSNTAQTKLVAELGKLLDKGLEQFVRHLPKAPKNCCGYRLERVRRDDGTLDLTGLFTGSEGTLGLVTEARVSLETLPKTRRLALANFSSLASMSEAVTALLPLAPSACEVMDRPFLELVRKTRPDLHRYLPVDSTAQLLIELDGDPAETADGMAKLKQAIEGVALQFVIADNEEDQEQLWAVRRAALPLLFTLPGPGRITPFIEDVSVAPDKLGEYLTRLHEIFARHGVESAVYGHAGDGNLHTRPILDLRQQSDVDLMRRLADEVFEVVIDLKGSISGEHGDGRVRTPFLPMFYGDGYELIQQTKQLLDGQELFNPTIIARSAPGSLIDDLKISPTYARRPLRPAIGGSHEQLANAIESCHGCAKCTTPSAVVSMCPLYKATGIPAASPRGKMALAQAVLAGELSLDIEQSRAMLDAFSYCLGCGLCKVDCPSKVPTAQVVKQFRSYLTNRIGLPIADRVLALLSTPIPRSLRPMAWFASLAGRNRVSRLLLEALLGVDRQAPLFHFAPIGLANEEVRGRERALYFPDTFAALCEPELGALCLEMLELAGYAPTTSSSLVACAPALARGDAGTARDVARMVASLVLPQLGPRTPLVFSEPTALQTVVDDYPLLLDDDEAGKRLESAAVDILFLLRERLGDGMLPARTVAADWPGPIVYHCPCHVRGTPQEGVAVDLLTRLGYDLAPLSTSCCGMAGTFGLKTGPLGFETSITIGAPVFAAIRAAKASLVVSECSACRLQIAAQTRVAAVHPIVLVARLFDRESHH